MAALSEKTIDCFYDLCNAAYESWAIHRVLFDDNPNIDRLIQNNEILGRLSVITQEYSLHQIAKLHDTVVMNGRINLTVDYIVDYGGWDKETLGKLDSLRKNLRLLADKIKKARNKLLSHNDLQVILEDEVLGEFEKDADCKYFEDLQEFMNIAHDVVVGGPCPFNDLVITDTRNLLLSL